MFGGLGADDGYRVTGADSVVAQRRSQHQCLTPQLAVGQVAGAGEDGGCVRLAFGASKEAVVQRLSAGGGDAAVDHVTHRALVRGQCRRVLLRPRVAGTGHPPQLVDVMSEHRVDHARREDVFAHIPIHHDTAVELGDLSVQRHLRPLRDDPTGRTECVGDVAGEQLAESQRTGEHDRGEHRGPAVAGQVPKHRQARVIGVRGGRPHGVLHSMGPRRRVGGAGQVDIEQ